MDNQVVSTSTYHRDSTYHREEQLDWVYALKCTHIQLSLDKDEEPTEDLSISLPLQGGQKNG